MLTKQGGRLFGRGAADDKSGVLIHALTIRLFGGRLPVGLKLVIEGEEETFSHLEAFVEERPDLFQADVMVLHEHRPVEVQRGATRVRASRPFIVGMGGSAVSDARVALAAAYGREVSTIVSAGSVPLLGALAKAYPDAAFVLWGADDAASNIHGTNESVDPSEIELMALAQADNLDRERRRARIVERRRPLDRPCSAPGGRSRTRTGRRSSSLAACLHTGEAERDRGSTWAPVDGPAAVRA